MKNVTFGVQPCAFRIVRNQQFGVGEFLQFVNSLNVGCAQVTGGNNTQPLTLGSGFFQKRQNQSQTTPFDKGTQNVNTVGSLNFFFKLTTFTGRKILYIEDLYVREEYRGKELGKVLLNKAREIAKDTDCEQIELKCADWNKASAEFYKAQGMKNENEWITFTLDKTLL